MKKRSKMPPRDLKVIAGAGWRMTSAKTGKHCTVLFLVGNYLDIILCHLPIVLLFSQKNPNPVAVSGFMFMNMG